jgi:hypothetical protein
VTYGDEAGKRGLYLHTFDSFVSAPLTPSSPDPAIMVIPKII